MVWLEDDEMMRHWEGEGKEERLRRKKIEGRNIRCEGGCVTHVNVR